MAARKKCSEALRQRATRMAIEAQVDPTTSHGAIKRIAEQLRIRPEPLRTWVRQAEADGAVRPGIMIDETARIAELERQVQELRPGNEILKSSALNSNRQRNNASNRPAGVS